MLWRVTFMARPTITARKLIALHHSAAPIPPTEIATAAKDGPMILPKFHWAFDNPMPEFPVPQQKGTVGKCIMCVHNVDKGKLPFCVDACSMDALYIVDLNSDVMTNGSGETYLFSKYIYDNDAFRYKEELSTSPRVWYVAGHGQDLAF